MGERGEREKIAIVYHYFAHYRRGVIEALLASDRYEFIFYSASKDPYAGNKSYQFADPKRFVRTPCWLIRHPFLWQFGVFGLCFRRDIKTIIFLSTPYFLSNWLYVPLCRLLGKRVIFWGHTWYTYDRGFKSWYKNLYYRLAHQWFVYGNVAKRLGISHGFPADRIHVVYNSLDYDLQVPARERVTPARLSEVRAELFGNDRPIVIYIGRLIPSKQVELLIQAAAYLRDEGQPINVLVVGDGSERPALEQLAQRENLANAVRFYGPCYEENRIAELMMASDVTGSPGNVGLAAIHSLMYGVPIVTHDDPEHHSGPELETIVPHATGGFFRRGDAVDLARALREWTVPGAVDETVRARCRRIIDRYWNPASQRMRIERALAEQPPLDDWNPELEPSPEASPIAT